MSSGVSPADSSASCLFPSSGACRWWTLRPDPCRGRGMSAFHKQSQYVCLLPLEATEHQCL